MKDERLTRRNADGTTWVKCASCDIQDKCDFTKESCCQELQDRLAELEDKIEQGTLIELPCKVGDIMYQVFHPSQAEPFPFEVEKIRVIIQADGIKVYVEEINGKGGTVGSMAFTREEAEKRLKELQNG